jgi:hypothetical protein
MNTGDDEESVGSNTVSPEVSSTFVSDTEEHTQNNDCNNTS